MTGLEMMLSKLLGMTPEQMKAQVNQATDLMKSGADAMAQVQRDLNLIKQHLGIQEVSENVQRAITAERGSNSANGSHIQL